MTDLLAPYGGYRRTFSFAFACLVYHATEVFCARNYSYKNDPLGKTVGQMIGAARSARQNIVEGSSRAGTSKETELRLYDTAKASLEELAGDYEAFLVGRNELPWAETDPRASRLTTVVLDRYQGPLSRHDYAAYILSMRRRFAEFLEAEDPVTAANSLLIVIDQACKLLHRQMESVAETFREEGGFTERMSRARLEIRDAQSAASGAPSCPECGKTMHKMVARKGRNAGQPFWSCTGYPDCNGTRPFTQEGPET
jgi:four helix bundle suffix protein